MELQEIPAPALESVPNPAPETGAELKKFAVPASGL